MLTYRFRRFDTNDPLFRDEEHYARPLYLHWHHFCDIAGIWLVKNWVLIRTIRAGVSGALEMLFVGALAAGASYGIVRAMSTALPGEA